MNVSLTLRRARALIAGGWVRGTLGLMCTELDGTPCRHDAEMVALFTVDGALRASTNDTLELFDAWALLEQVHHPLLFAADELLGTLPKDAAAITADQVRAYVQLARAAVAARETYLDFWLERPWRQLPDVLQLFDLAISRANAREAA